MTQEDMQDYNFTEAGWETLYDTVDDPNFLDQDARLIFRSLERRLKIRSFGDYLKRYICRKAQLTTSYQDVPLADYQSMIRSAFSDNHTPPSFTPTTAKLSALSKNWLTQRTVKRNVVFLLGFGLGMSVENVNELLTKALLEREINPKDPFEVVCWYCYKNQFSYYKFEELWERYQAAPANALASGLFDVESTIGARNAIQGIHDDATLLAYLLTLKAKDGTSTTSFSARRCFDALYAQARDLVAGLYNAQEDEDHSEALGRYIDRLSRSDRLSDVEKQQRIQRFRDKKRVFTREDITESDLEQVICAAIPTDRHGNLRPSKASKLGEQFAGKRFSRQHIGEILSGKAEVTRFDLITLHFFVFSQQLDVYPEPKTRCLAFQDSMDAMLAQCFLGEMYIQNPYECFVLMCLLSNDPLGTYADVWELSYDQE